MFSARSRHRESDRLRFGLALADRSVSESGLNEKDAEVFLRGAVSAFEISRKPVDRSWYRELEQVSAVAADIAGVASTHINHITPRVLDIDLLYARMEDRGIEMIDRIQGPPKWAGPDVLLRQRSIRALSEARLFREDDGSVNEGTLRVRFGEVEARGIALTASGRAIYDRAILDADTTSNWGAYFPDSERGLLDADLGFFTYTVTRDSSVVPRPELSIPQLLDEGWLRADPIVYEDLLPRSAAGIFQSNLTEHGSKDDSIDGVEYDLQWLSEAIQNPIVDPLAVYAAERDQSLAVANRRLGRPITQAARTDQSDKT